MVGHKTIEHVQIRSDAMMPNDTCEDANGNNINAEKSSDQSQKSNTDQVQQEVDDPFAPSQYWYSPGFHKTCDKTIERIIRVDASGAPSFSLECSPLDVRRVQIQTKKAEAQV